MLFRSGEDMGGVLTDEGGGIVAEIPTVGEGIEDAWICGCGLKLNGLTFVNFVRFNDRDNSRRDVIDFDGYRLTGGFTIESGDCQADVVGAVVGICVGGVLTDYYRGVVAEVPGVG